MKIERLLGILLFIINRDNVTANTLAQRFDVSRRTILRDIDTLSLAGIPVYSEVGSKGGYSINSHYNLNEKIIDDTNRQYILQALESLKSVYGQDKVQETYEKVKHIYSDNEGTYKGDIDFSVANENRSVISDVSVLKEAIESSRAVTFQYTNSDGCNRKVKANAIHVLYKWYGWYAFGYDLEKGDFRMFKVVRMKNLKVTDDNFNNDYNLRKLLEEHEDRRNEDNVEITLEYSKEIEVLADEYFYGESHSVDERFLVKKTTIKKNDYIMFSIILGFGNKMRVIAPKWYKDKVEEHLRRTLDIYNSDI